MDGSRDSYRVKSEREKQISYINTYIWNLENWHKSSYLQSKNRDRCREQIYGHQGGREGGWDELEGWD